MIGAAASAVFWSNPAVAQNDPASPSYSIGPRDKIVIQVDETTDLNMEVTVAEDGTVSLPVVGTLQVQGLTGTQLENRLRERLEGRGLRKATVNVSVTNFRSRPVSVLGAVGVPGNHSVPGRSTLLEVLMDAGGIKENHGPEIIVSRRADNGLSAQVRIAVTDLIEAGEAKFNIPVFAGDLINVPMVRQLTVHLIGEVDSPGTLVFRSDERATLLTAIARAGGLTDNAARKIRVQRQVPASEEREELFADFRDLLNNRIPDIPLEDGDLIVVKESFF